MEINVSESAAQWYTTELDITNLTSIRFFVRYGGVGGLIPGFSLGINIEEMPEHVHAKQTVGSITFFVSEEDAWYFESKQALEVTLDEQTKEPQITYR